jgi:hypothetical protein
MSRKHQTAPRNRPLLPAPLAVLALSVALLLTAVAPAAAEVHVFKPLHAKHSSVKRFRVVGVAAPAVVGARLMTRRGPRGFPVARVRRAARSPRHLLRAKTSSRSGAQALKVTTTPETEITAGPAEGSETSSSSAQFSFSSSSSKATFYCSLDGAAAGRCSSGVSYGSLAPGSHHFTVYAVDRYGISDPTPAARSWTVTPSAGQVTNTPDTGITSGPAEGSATTSGTASFWFVGTDRVGVTGYECSLDGAAFSSCPSPQVYSGLSVGAHTFSVRSVDADGATDSTPASRSWTVSPSGPTYTVPSSVPSECGTDATSQILTWIGSVPDGSTVSLGSGACYRIEGSLELRGRRLTIEGNGATFRSFNAPEDQRAMLRLWNSNITLRNLSIVGSYAKGGTFTPGLEHAHGIDLRGTSAVIENTSISDVGGDCVYFGLGNSRSSGAVRESSCQGTGRNGVSVTAGENISVEHVDTSRIGYIAFDVEPNSSSGSGAAGVVFGLNTIGSFSMKAFTVIGNAPVANLMFASNRVVGQGLKIGVANGAYRPRDLTITGNSSDTAAAPAAMNVDGVEGLTVNANRVPLMSGAMADVEGSCGVSVSGNSFPGGSIEASLTNSAAQC